MPSIPDALFDESAVRRLLDDSPLLFVALTGDGDLVWASAPTRRILGWGDDLLTDAHIADLVHPDDLDVVARTMAEDVRGSWDREHLVVRVRHSSGHYQHLEFGGMDLRDDEGAGIYLVWARSAESTTRVSQFMAALAGGAPLQDLVGQVLHWFDSTSEDNDATVMLRHPDGRYEAAPWGIAVDSALHVSFDPARSDPPGADFGVWRQAIRTGELQVQTDLNVLPEEMTAATTSSKIQTLWVFPIHTAVAAEPSALVNIWRRHDGPPLASHRRLLDGMAQYLRLAIEWDASHRALVEAASTDSLTGLSNRAALAQAITNDQSPLVAVLFCDLDDFKVINDRHGHLVGDRLLQEAARRLTTAVGDRAVLARIGGDEFAVFYPALASAHDADQLADAIVAALDVPIEVNGQRHRVGCSVGVAVAEASERGGDDVSRLLGDADRALYRAKDAGKGRWYRGSSHAEPPLPFPT